MREWRIHSHLWLHHLRIRANVTACKQRLGLYLRGLELVLLIGNRL